MSGAYAKLLFYAAAVAAAGVEFFASLLAGIWHSPVYWTSVGSIVPIGLFGIWYLAFLHTPARNEAGHDPRDLPCAHQHDRHA